MNELWAKKFGQPLERASQIRASRPCHANDRRARFSACPLGHLVAAISNTLNDIAATRPCWASSIGYIVGNLSRQLGGSPRLASSDSPAPTSQCPITAEATRLRLFIDNQAVAASSPAFVVDFSAASSFGHSWKCQPDTSALGWLNSA